MGGVTVAHQPTKNDNDMFLSSFNTNPTSSPDTRSDMVESLLPSHGWPMEDLTEVHEVMLRESMNWIPWVEDTNHSVKTGSPMESLDSQLLAQTLQLDGLFGQELNFDSFDQAGSSLLNDEFALDSSPLSTPPSSQDHQQLNYHNYALPAVDGHLTFPTIQACEDKIMDTTTDASSTDDDDDDDSDGDSDDEQDGSVSVLTSTYMCLPKRQMEESLLNKITHQLQPDKLPGILSIVSRDDEKQVYDEEVEIDLASLVREQLVRVMLYVDACITEQQGGPKVNLDHYLVDDNNKSIKKKTQTIVANDGPISMATLTKKSRSARKQQAKNVSSPPKRRRQRKKSDQGMVSTRPSRRAAALHKRRMLEDMLLVPSDHEDDTNDGLNQQVMVTYGEEQMDFKVIENQTIVHHSPSLPSSGGGGGDLCIETSMDDDDDDEEEIDIM